MSDRYKLVLAKGTSSQFIKGDGTLDSSTYGTGDVTLAGSQTITNKDLTSPTNTIFKTGTIGTASATAAKTVTLNAPYASYTPVVGDLFIFTYTLGTSVSTATIAVNGGAAKNVRLANASATSTGHSTAAGGSLMYRYDGTYFNLFGSQQQADSNTTYIESTTGTAVTTTTQTCAVNNLYYANNATTVAFTLPATCAINSVVEIVGLNATGTWSVIAPSGVNIIIDGNDTGVAGTLTGAVRSTLKLRCIVANTTWEVVTYTGVIVTNTSYSTAKQPAGTYSTDIHSNITALNAVSGTNTGDNATNTTYTNDYRAANFVAGTNYIAPNGSAAGLTSFPTLNQNTSGTAANLSGTPALPNGVTATTQSANDNSTKIATTAYVDAGATPALKSATTVVNVSSATAPTTGQVLTATSGIAATWQTPTGGSSTSPVINVYTSSGTWTKPVGLKWIEVELVGAGGGTDYSGSYGAGSSGSGGYAKKKYDVSALSATEAYVVGASNTTAGAQTGSSTFKSITVTGGYTGSVGSGEKIGGAGGTATGGDININGQRGGVYNNTTSNGFGTGGSTPLGLGGVYAGGSSVAQTGTGYGSGNSCESATGQSNLLGKGGVVIIREFY